MLGYRASSGDRIEDVVASANFAAFHYNYPLDHTGDDEERPLELAAHLVDLEVFFEEDVVVFSEVEKGKLGSVCHVPETMVDEVLVAQRLGCK